MLVLKYMVILYNVDFGYTIIRYFLAEKHKILVSIHGKQRKFFTGSMHA